MKISCATSRPVLLASIFCLFVLLLAGCGGGGAEPTPTPTKTPVVQAAAPTQTPTPTQPTPLPALPTPTQETAPTVPPIPANPGNISPFTGLPVADPTRLQRRPILICVNNDPVGRGAHHGLTQADLVYEYIVDGFTITRLTALYQSQESERIGPVRSARMPNIWMTYMYDGVLACSGGSDEVRYLLKNEVGFPYLDADLDDPSQTRYFSSIGSDYRTRMQASTAGVERWLADSGDANSWSRPGFQFSQNPPANSERSSTVIAIPYPGSNNVEWRYDAGSNQYLRFQGGIPHIDLMTGSQIRADNVVVLFAQHTLTDIVEDSLGTKGVDIQLYDFGAFRIFRDGQAYVGTWRADPKTPPRWLGPGEAIVQLKPGQTWIQVVRDTDTISY